MKRKFIVAFILIGNILVIFWLYQGSKTKTKEQQIERCSGFKAGSINELIYRAYYVRSSVVFELVNGEKLDWKCDYLGIAGYRHRLKNYPSESMIETWLKRNFQKHGSLDSLYKPSNSFDFYIYLDSNPDSVIHLPCNYDCKDLLK